MSCSSIVFMVLMSESIGDLLSLSREGEPSGVLDV